MTYRIYIRWPDQRVTDKTVTENSAVATTAHEALTSQAESLRARGALGIAFTEDGKQISYTELNQDPAGRRSN